ncbi:MAG: hypothetical protein ACOVNY_11645 [Chitinophagaceae bacterium]
MKIFFILLVVFTIALNAQSQIKAITEEGKEVVLFENGKWRYVSDSSTIQNAGTDSLQLNSTKFLKSVGATFLIKSKIFNVGVNINPTKWVFTGRKPNEKNPEYNFTLKNGDAYGMFITESIPISLESLRQAAFGNAQRASYDIKETFAEYRNVNNKKLLCLEMKGTVNGIKVAYLGYYYSNDNGTVQLVTYTMQKDYENLKKELEIFLNGFTEVLK